MSAEPAYSIIENLGGVTSVAATLGVTRQTVWKWTTPKGRSGGTGGKIPLDYHRPLLELAIRKNVALTAADFLPGEVPFGGKRPDVMRPGRKRAAISHAGDAA